MTREEIYKIVKNDLIRHPEKRNNMQFCVACYAYGIDLNQVDESIKKTNSEALMLHKSKIFIGTSHEWEKLSESEKNQFVNVYTISEG